MRNKILISYSHVDKAYLKHLQVHLNGFRWQTEIQYWADTDLRPGEQWQETIQKISNETAVAIFLASADFPNSEFIQCKELPPLLKAWETNKITLIPVIVKPCNFSILGKLYEYQAVNDPKVTLSEMSESDQERIWAKLSKFAFHEAEDYISKHPNEIPVTKQEASVSFIPQGAPAFHYQIQDLLAAFLEQPGKIHNCCVYQYFSNDITDFLPVFSSLALPSSLLRLLHFPALGFGKRCCVLIRKDSILPGSLRQIHCPRLDTAIKYMAYWTGIPKQSMGSHTGFSIHMDNSPL